MDDSADPILQFFSSTEAEKENILYATLSISPSASAEEIRKAYRRLALVHHPDKHSSKSDEAKQTAAKEFQKIGFAYAVLSDEKRRKTYDKTGKTAESAFADAEEMGWDKYFETLFTRIDRKALDDDKAKYQGSEDEKEDLKAAYEQCKGSLPQILEHIPHATNEDEDRLIGIVNDLIAAGELESSKKWTSTSSDKNAQAKRAKAASKQAKEAEAAAKELGVWDEFYGTGKKGKRKGEKEDTNGEGALQALMLRRQKDRSNAFDALADKYAKIQEEEDAQRKAKGKKRKSDAREDAGELDDAAFEALQAKMLANRDKEKQGETKTKKKSRP